MDQDTYDARITKWESLIREANSSGISKSEWCQLHGISKYKFYYWQRKVQARAGAELQIKTAGCNDLLKSEPASSLVELRLPAVESWMAGISKEFCRLYHFNAIVLLVVITIQMLLPTYSTPPA